MSDEAAPKQGSFDNLLAEIGSDLHKAIPAAEGDTGKDDTKIAAAAAEGEEAEEGGKPKDDDEAQGAEVSKSFKVKLDDGTELEAVDGAELIKSLVDRVEKNEGAVLAFLRDTIAPVIKSQDEVIKSLQAEVAKLGDSGKGRKAVIGFVPKPAATADEIAKSETEGQMTGEEFMAKALIAQTDGRITATQVATAESYLNSGKAPPAEIIRAVISGK